MTIFISVWTIVYVIILMYFTHRQNAKYRYLQRLYFISRNGKIYISDIRIDGEEKLRPSVSYVDEYCNKEFEKLDNLPFWKLPKMKQAIFKIEELGALYFRDQKLYDIDIKIDSKF